MAATRHKGMCDKKRFLFFRYLDDRLLGRCFPGCRVLRVCSFRRIQKRIVNPRFAGFRGRNERETRNWICNLGNLS